MFGLTTPEVAQLKASGYNPWDYYHGNSELKQVIDMIASGFFSVEEEARAGRDPGSRWPGARPTRRLPGRPSWRRWPR
ncbi:glycogen/starch/alpha-glucan phosphorylase [Mycobacterium tuberculosis]